MINERTDDKFLPELTTAMSTVGFEDDDVAMRSRVRSGRARRDMLTILAVQFVLVICILVALRPSFVLSAAADFEMPRLHFPTIVGVATLAILATIALLHAQVGTRFGR